ncbi:hypothetical protein, partial [Pseudomonas syringae]|uniref:hypothetical protein n=1 Tax=Pseudomonas syringae TaxID=317 RepID=UPI001F48596D
HTQFFAQTAGAVSGHGTILINKYRPALYQLGDVKARQLLLVTDIRWSDRRLGNERKKILT